MYIGKTPVIKHTQGFYGYGMFRIVKDFMLIVLSLLLLNRG